MHLKYEFVVVTHEFCLRDIRLMLREEYDFVYTPFIPGEQKLFRDSLPELEGYHLPLKALLFKYVADAEDGYFEHVAAQDINSGLEYLGIMGWDTFLIWEWRTCEEEAREKGRIDIAYRYDGDGDDQHIHYDRAPQKEEILVHALDAIIEHCNINSEDGETQAEFAERIELMAVKALSDYEQRRMTCR